MTLLDTYKFLQNGAALLSNKMNFHNEMTPLNTYKNLHYEVTLLSN